MEHASHYWTFLYLSASGTPQHKTIERARSWLEQQCGDLISQPDLPHRAIQRRLKAQQMTAAEACLRCYISQQIIYACRDLETSFGKRHSFSGSDLLPLVLDDASLISDGYAKAARLVPGEHRSPSAYRSFATKVLESFDPQQSSLSSWTSRLVRQDSEVNVVLLEKGVYLVSDWAILNDTKLSQLESALGGFHQLSAAEVKQAIALLEGYHAVYRHDRWRQKQSGRCSAPATSQLQRIAAYLTGEYALALSANQVMQRLQTLAQQLRTLRIYNRSKVLPADSLDISDQAVTLDSLATEADPEDDSVDVFLAKYRQQFLSSLDDALKTVVEQRVTCLGQRKGDRPQRFLKGLQLFHCLGEAMRDIAPQIGCVRQDQVTSLLKLKPLRTDVRHQMLMLLRDRILPLAEAFTNPANLEDLDQRLDQALDEETADLIRETELETSIRRDGPLKSRFARHLCRYLDNRI